MKITVDIPDLSGLRPQNSVLYLSRYWTGGGPKDVLSYALVMNLVRLVDLTVSDYENGRQCIEMYWNTHRGVAMGAAIAASGHFESCITNVHRSILYLRALRTKRSVSPALKRTLPESAEHLDKRVGPVVRDVRNAIHHLDGDITHSRLGDEHWLCLIPQGEIRCHDGQEIKRIDRIKLWDKEIRFGSLAKWPKI